MSSTQPQDYPQPPPSYGAEPSPTKANFKPYSDNEPDREPLLASPTAGSSSGAGAYYDQPAHGELPDDFKYGTTVSESSPSVRQAFVRKVYSILFVQILATCITSGIISQSPGAIGWVQANVWAFYVTIIGTFITLGLLYWKRHSHPINLVFLSAFTLMEAFTIGVTLAFYDNIIILQALIITLGVFTGLTLFTFQSKYDFEGMGPFLFGGLIALIATGFVGIFIPFSRTFDIVLASGGCVLFSGYIVYDTYLINKRLSPDEYIMASISLYLDFINLFLNILRLLNNVER